MHDEKKKIVLIVDDDTEFTTNFSKKIAEVELQPVVAITPKEALDYVANHNVSFIVLDFVMPEMDGATIHTLIKRDMRKNIPTIILTNFPNLAHIPQDVEVYVKLKTDLDQLVQAINERLSSTI